MAGISYFTKEEILTWYKDYSNYQIPVNQICKKYGIKSDTLKRRFKVLGLKLRPQGFQVGNCKGKDVKDNLRLRLLWRFNFSYKRRAKKKGIKVDISEDQFINLVTGSCHYCGLSYLEETRVTGHGHKINMLTVDRLDSSKGYIVSNCVPACKQCNTMKMDYDFNSFIEKAHKIASLHPKK